MKILILLFLASSFSNANDGQEKLLGKGQENLLGSGQENLLGKGQTKNAGDYQRVKLSGKDKNSTTNSGSSASPSSMEAIGYFSSQRR